MDSFLQQPPLLLPDTQAIGIRRLIAACRVGSPPAVFQLTGLCGSLPLVLAVNVYHALQGEGKHVFVFPNEEMLTHYLKGMQAWLPQLKVHSLLPVDEDEDERTTSSQRLSAVQRSCAIEALFGDPAAWVLTVPTALAIRVPKAGHARRQRQVLQRDDKLQTDRLCKQLEDMGFVACEEVHLPGTYVLRNGRLDVFSYAYSRPVRVTFWGDTITRLSFFTAVDQLSCEEVETVELLGEADISIPYSEQTPLLCALPKGVCFWWMEEVPPAGMLSAHLPHGLSDYLALHVQLHFGGEELDHTGVEKLRWDSCLMPPLRDFAEIATHLAEKQQQGYRVYLTQTSALRGVRLREVLQSYVPTLQVALLPTLHAGFVLPAERILCYTDHELMGCTPLLHVPKQLPSDFSLRQLQAFQTGDYVVHMDHGIGRFVGLEVVTQAGHTHETLRLVYRDNDLLYVSVHALHKLVKYSGRADVVPRLSKLGSRDWQVKTRRIKRKLKDMVQELVQLYAKRKRESGYAFPPDSFSEAALVSSFLYEDTPDQATATTAIMADMAAPHPMDRLICGDVGFGKTEVAIRASFRAVRAGKQVAILVPTTILALQHYRTFSKRLAPFDVRIGHLHRFRTLKEQQALQVSVQAGDIDILIGTSAILSQQVCFKDLKLLIVDEEQKFGVRIKEQLKIKRTHLDILTLSATPIPRTMHFSLIGVRDISVIATPPPGRQPIHTSLHCFDKDLLREAISMELARKGQVFFVQNRIVFMPQTASLLQQLLPDARIAVAHGQMSGQQLEETMYQFVAGKHDVLLCTNIIENGLDIPNANTIIIQDAHLFGLAELHQMRGRVGRSESKAFCYLLTPALSSLSPQAVKRLSAVEAFAALGDGYNLALKDLDIRGAGNLLGAEQSGFMGDLGFEMYHKVLDEGMRELKASGQLVEGADTFTPPGSVSEGACTFETDMEAYLPASYVPQGNTRMLLYKELGELRDVQAVTAYKKRVTDRFGEVPAAAMGLFQGATLRILGDGCFFEKITLKRSCLHVFFDTRATNFMEGACFSRMLTFVQQRPQSCKLSEEQSQGSLRITPVATFQEALSLLSEFVEPAEKIIKLG